MHKLRKSIHRLLSRAGYDLIQQSLSTSSAAVLERAVRLAGQVGTVIDVGASDGRWSRELMTLLPDQRYLLVEAQERHRPALRQFERETGAHFVLAAASDHTGTLHFLDNGQLSGSASSTSFGESDIEVPCVSLDEVVKERELPGRYLLKLDTHGHEVEILNGSRDVLSRAALVMLETYTFANFGRLMFDEMCQHMRSLGFRPAGIADVMARSDGLLWQSDILFLPSAHPAFADTTYAPLR
jgi:FkbM family methyltransferase